MKDMNSDILKEVIESLNCSHIRLLKDSFNFIIEDMNIDSGMLLLHSTSGNLISSWDFPLKKEAVSLSRDSVSWKEIVEKNDYTYINIKLPDTCNCHLKYLSGSTDEIDARKFKERISDKFVNTYNLLKKYSNQADMIFRALDSVSDAITYCDKYKVIRYVNKACLNTFEASVDDLVGKNILDIISGKSMLVEILRTGKSVVDVEYVLKYKGKKYEFINSGYPVFGNDKEIIGAIDIYRSLERTRKLANNLTGYSAVYTFDDLIGSSNKMKELVKYAKLYSESEETILIVGESGTGKELIAQSIHNHSNRSGGPFIAINCANFPNELIDSELFGYEEGSFTGAKKGGRQGKFEAANGGTLFLDEIGEMPIHLQSKLLRVLETKTITKIGSNTPVTINVRIIAATNRDLDNHVENGGFRSDLYYRLKVLWLQTPSLKSRDNDVIELAEYFTRKIAEKTGKNDIVIEEDAKKVLLDYDWPGNVRQLENMISRAVVVCQGNTIDREVLVTVGIKESDDTEITRISKVRISKDLLIKSIDQTNGNKKKVAEMLGISRPTLYKLLKKYNIK
jgi:transcriptional regulator with PAS, ATPase and Fis domain